MLKVVPLNEISSIKNWILCQNIRINGKNLHKRLPINEDIIQFIKLNTNSSKDYFIIVSNTDFTSIAVKEFSLSIIKKVIKNEIDYINSRYNYIIEKEFISRIEKIILEICKELDYDKYISKLISNSFILRKSIDLSIMGFYFSIKMHLKFKELEEIIFSSLLLNLNLCGIDKGFTNFKSEDFLVKYKESLIETSYNLIKDDKNIPINSKRIVKYANIDLQNKSEIYINEDNKKILKDVTLEIVQLSNDILTYNFNDNISRVYLNKRYNLIQPALNTFFVSNNTYEDDKYNDNKHKKKNKKSFMQKMKDFFTEE